MTSIGGAGQCQGENSQEDEVAAAHEVCELVELEGERKSEADELVGHGDEESDGQVVVVQHVDCCVSGHIGESLCTAAPFPDSCVDETTVKYQEYYFCYWKSNGDIRGPKARQQEAVGVL